MSDDAHFVPTTRVCMCVVLVVSYIDKLQLLL